MTIFSTLSEIAVVAKAVAVLKLNIETVGVKLEQKEELLSSGNCEASSYHRRLFDMPFSPLGYKSPFKE